MDQETMAALTPAYITNTKCSSCRDCMVVTVPTKSWLRKLLGYTDYHCLGCGDQRKVGLKNLTLTVLTDRELPMNVAELLGVMPAPTAATTLRILQDGNNDG